MMLFGEEYVTGPTFVVGKISSLTKNQTTFPRSSSPYQYSATNVMHFLFNLLRIKSLYMFEHYLLILRRRSHAALGIQVPLVEILLRMSK
jgi:hypothetical protein